MLAGCNTATVSWQLCSLPGGPGGLLYPGLWAAFGSLQAMLKAPGAGEFSASLAGPGVAVPADRSVYLVITCPCQLFFFLFCCDNSNVLIGSLSAIPAAVVKTLFLWRNESKQALKAKAICLQAGPTQNNYLERVNLNK